MHNFPLYVFIAIIYSCQNFTIFRQQKLPTALNRLYEFLYQPPVKVAIYGPLLSSMTTLLAEVIGKWNIVEVSTFWWKVWVEIDRKPNWQQVP